MTPRELFAKISEEDDLGSIMVRGLIAHTPLAVLCEQLPTEEQSLVLFYEDYYRMLQFLCAELATGDPDFDSDGLALATKTLALIRQNLNQEFKIDLPELPVVSMVDELIAYGFLKIVPNESGEKVVVLEDSPYDLKIRIVRTPSGQAPEEVRNGWIGVELSARYIPGTVRIRGLVDGELSFRVGGQFSVSYRDAVTRLQEKSPASAQWFLENLGENYSVLLFDADCAETIQTH